jgi:hypothetical protein
VEREKMGVSATKGLQEASANEQHLMMRVNSTSNVTDVCNALIAAGVRTNAVTCAEQINRHMWVEDSPHSRRMVQTQQFQQHIQPSMYTAPGSYIKHVEGTHSEMMQVIADLKARKGIQVTAHSPATHLGPKVIYVTKN